MLWVVLVGLLLIILLCSLEVLFYIGIVAFLKNIFDNSDPERARLWAKRVLIVGFFAFVFAGVVGGLKIFSVYHCNDKDLNNLQGKDKLICAFEAKERELKQIEIDAADRRQDRQIEADKYIAIILKQMEIDADNARHDKEMALKYPDHMKESIGYEIIDTHDTWPDCYSCVILLDYINDQSHADWF